MYLNNKYELRQLICIPYSNHYSCLIIKNQKYIKNIKLDGNYYYDSHNIIIV